MLPFSIPLLILSFDQHPFLSSNRLNQFLGLASSRFETLASQLMCVVMEWSNSARERFRLVTGHYYWSARVTLWPGLCKYASGRLHTCAICTRNVINMA